MATPVLPKYAAGLEVPICGMTRARDVKRGDWVIIDWGGIQKIAAVVETSTVDGQVLLDAVFYPDTNRVRPYRSSRWVDADSWVQDVSGYVE